MQTLDVGCGVPSRYHQPIKGENVIHVDRDRTAVHLEVQCDAHNLPFQNSIFSTVYANHILEHLNNPIKAIQEMKRVSAKRVVIKVPNASYFKWKNSCVGHIFSWNQYTLRNLLERYFRKVIINSTQRDLSKNRLRKAVSIILTLLHGHTELTGICFKEEK